ncbi:hypothetical protein HMPREF9124_0303 [Oribacterium sp. oral taxon 108 str. F0425]|nr:hypothetical protein HMPREF9124_0303 [Oribacterium sp. oral taxon 108 str. F0425]
MVFDIISIPPKIPLISKARSVIKKQVLIKKFKIYYKFTIMNVKRNIKDAL